MHINLEDRVETLLADLKEPAWGNLAQRWGLWEMTVWGRHPLMIWEDNLCSMELAHAELIWGFQSFNMLMCTWTPRGQPVHFLTSADSSPSAYLWGLWLSLQWEPVTQLPGLPAPSWLLSLCFIPPHISHERCQVHVTWPCASATPVFLGLLQDFHLFIFIF